MNAYELVEKLQAIIEQGYGSRRVTIVDGTMGNVVNLDEPQVKEGTWYREESIEGFVYHNLRLDGPMHEEEREYDKETVIVL